MLQLLKSAWARQKQLYTILKGFSGGSDGKESACDVGDLGSIPELGKFPWMEGMATYSSILAWRIPWTQEPGLIQVYGVTKSRTQLSDVHFHDT